MTRFIIVACLLAVQLNCGLSAKTRSFTEKRPTAELYITDKGAKECVIVSNKGYKFTYKPTSEFSHENPRIRRASDNSCSVELIKLDKDDLGLWTITQYNKNGKSTIYEYNIYFEKYGDISPTSTMKIYKGYYAIARIKDDIQNIIACEVTTPEKESFDILQVKKKDIEKFDTCGVRITVDHKFNGKWRLAAIDKNKEMISAEFDLDVLDDRKLITAQQNISLKLGSSSDIILKDVESSYCQLTDSHGVQLPITIGQCKHSIEVVTPYHDGLWKARYGVQGRLNPIELDIMVTTYDAHNVSTANVISAKMEKPPSSPPRIFTDSEAVITSIEATTNNDEVNMVCRLPIVKALRYCLFTSPEGKMLHISPGVGVKKYEFYRETHKGICGLTIHKPDEKDYGIWRCELTLDDIDSYKRYGSFLHLYHDKVDNSSATSYAALPLQNINVFGYNVSVKYNDSFTIKCGADTALHYCWLRSPNGTTYSITEDEDTLSSNTLLYTGLGYQQGECGAIVQNAMYEHKGTWNCYMGIKNQPELETSILVDVQDNYILAEEKTVTHNGETNRSLFCHLLPHLDKNIDYCRWIRPDGRGIYGDASGRYVSEMFDGSCGLTILGNQLRHEDVGFWTCIAGLSGRTTMEVSTTIEVNKPSMQIATLAGIIIGACALLAIVAGVLIVINLRKRRLAVLPPNNPPPYDAEQISVIPPKSMLQAQMQYDQKNWIDPQMTSR